MNIATCVTLLNVLGHYAISFSPKYKTQNLKLVGET